MSPPSVFVDTSAWYALVDRRDREHPRIRRIYEEGVHVSWITTDYVLDETLTLLSARLGAGVALTFLDALRSSVRAQLLLTDEGRFDRAIALFRRYRAHRFSFTDCVSFAAMADRRIRTALALDADFRVAGFDLWKGED